MKLKDLRIGWRTLIQQPANSLSVILGLSIGLAACLLLLGFVKYSLDYDSHVPDVDNVYVVTQRYHVDPKSPLYDVAPMFLRSVATNTPGVMDATSFFPSRPQTAPLVINIDDRKLQLQGLYVLPGFANMLGLKAQQGNLRVALDQPDSIVLTEASAVRLFGTPNALGRTMRAEGKVVRVGAVVAAPPANTTIPFDSLLGVNSALMDKTVRNEILTGEQGWMGKLLIRVKPGASLAAITGAFQQVVDRTPSIQNQPPETLDRLGKRKVMDLGLTPLRRAYFDKEVEGSRVFVAGKRGDPVVVAGLAAIGVLILGLAAINYVNLATVRVLRRQREVAMRKVLGASVGRIVLHFLMESLALSLVATAIGLLLAWLALPIFSELVNRDLSGMLSPANIVAAMSLGVALGVLTAIYPAWIAVRVLPTQVLAGRPGTESAGGMRFRRILTVVQVATAMGFAAVTAAIAWQTEFAMRSSPGFDPAPFLIVDLPAPVRYSDPARAFITALKAQRGIEGVALSEDPVGRLDNAWTRELRREGGAGAGMDMKGVSANFFELYGIQPRTGRLFQAALDQEDDPVPVVLNAAATRDLGFVSPESALGQIVLFTDYENKIVRKRVLGIAPDLHFHSLREAPRATAYELWTASTTLSVRTSGSPAEAEKIVRELWLKYFPDAIMKTHRARDILAVNYADDARLARLLAIATCITLLIAAFGTYVLSANTVQRRAGEIVLRKLHGAGRPAIARLVMREIGMLTLIAAVIGLPLAALGIRRYLSTYVVQAPIGYWTLGLALTVTMVVALVAISRHTWIAMRMAPVEALRT